MNQPSKQPSRPSAMAVQKSIAVGETWVLSPAWALTRVLGQGQMEGVGLHQCL